jgi:hypothetical protein
MPDRDQDADRKVYDARRYKLARLFSKLPSRFEYVYDFGDRWEHVIELENEEPAEYRKQYPIIVSSIEAMVGRLVSTAPASRTASSGVAATRAPASASRAAAAGKTSHTLTCNPAPSNLRANADPMAPTLRTATC